MWVKVVPSPQIFLIGALQDEKLTHDGESREHRGLKGSGEEVRRHRGDREPAERDKRKERRQREKEEEEEEEPERNHPRDGTSSKKPASDKSLKRETKTEPVSRPYTLTRRSFYYLLMVP